ncbi:putative Gastrulation defective protein 1 like protein [Blattamonas nauphoetae]|uniref:Gastrulation defective protein 1 like protein n=1 Tax=Blattamonas nauphoetae TaxID=2049346 RepID=A0ABQ9Y9Y0_9EUKA|nr:putative Gastrulation defective protein 1 like protein [Blattamonas nauphoetae]
MREFSMSKQGFHLTLQPKKTTKPIISTTKVAPRQQDSVYEQDDILEADEILSMMKRPESFQSEILKEETDDSSRPEQYPISNTFSFGENIKTITAISFDRSGTHAYVGDKNGQIFYYNFNSMDEGGESYRDVSVFDGQSITGLKAAPKGSEILATSLQSIPMLLDQRGDIKLEFVKGDMYVFDRKTTAGHTASINGCEWSPIVESNEFATWSMDGTVRLWDCTNKFNSKLSITICDRRSKDGGRGNATAFCYSSDSTLYAAGDSTGTISLWDPRKNMNVPIRLLPQAHDITPNVDTVDEEKSITCITFLSPSQIITRGIDSQLKVWDIRHLPKITLTATAKQTAEPLFSFHVPNENQKGSVILSPGRDGFIAGTSYKDEKKGEIVFFTDNGKVIEQHYSLPCTDAITALEWHPGLNQIAYAMPGTRCNMLYSPILSSKGALLSSAKAKRAQRMDYAPAPEIENPEDGKSMHRQLMQLMRKKEMGGRYSKADYEEEGDGHSGRLGAPSVKSSIMMNLLKKNEEDLFMDPQKVLTDLNEKAEREKMKREQQKPHTGQ